METKRPPLVGPDLGHREQFSHVQDWLYQSGKKYEDHIESLRAQQALGEMEEMRDPKITARTRSLFEHDTRSVLSRLTHKGKEMSKKKSREIHLKEKAEDEAIKGIPFKPQNITKLAEGKNRSDIAQIHESWEQGRRKRIEDKRVANEKAQEPIDPTLDAHSRRLAKKVQNQRYDMKVEDWLMFSKKIKQVKAWYKMQEEMAEAMPKITPYAASLKRDGDIGTRLYSNAIQEKTKVLAENALRERIAENEAYSVEVTSGATVTEGSMKAKRRHSYSGGSTTHSGSSTSRPRVEDTMLERHRKAQEERELRKKREEAEEAARHNPEINPVSKELAESMPLSSKERLYSNATGPRGSTCRQPPDNPSYPFAPQINHKSRLIDASKEACTLRGPERSPDGKGETRIHTWKVQDKKKQERLSQLTVERTERMMEQCTFRPNANNRTYTKDTNTLRAGPIEKRSAIWLKKRNDRLKHDEQKNQFRELEGCTFQPNVNRYDMTVPEVTSIVMSDYQLDGIEEFVTRQALARKMREESKKSHETNPKWKNSITIPKEFNLSSSNKSSCQLKEQQQALHRRQQERRSQKQQHSRGREKYQNGSHSMSPTLERRDIQRSMSLDYVNRHVHTHNLSGSYEEATDDCIIEKQYHDDSGWTDSGEWASPAHMWHGQQATQKHNRRHAYDTSDEDEEGEEEEGDEEEEEEEGPFSNAGIYGGGYNPMYAMYPNALYGQGINPMFTAWGMPPPHPQQSPYPPHPQLANMYPSFPLANPPASFVWPAQQKQLHEQPEYHKVGSDVSPTTVDGRSSQGQQSHTQSISPIPIPPNGNSNGMRRSESQQHALSTHQMDDDWPMMDMSGAESVTNSQNVKDNAAGLHHHHHESMTNDTFTTHSSPIQQPHQPQHSREHTQAHPDRNIWHRDRHHRSHSGGGSGAPSSTRKNNTPLRRAINPAKTAPPTPAPAPSLVPHNHNNEGLSRHGWGMRSNTNISGIGSSDTEQDSFTNNTHTFPSHHHHQYTHTQRHMTSSSSTFTMGPGGSHTQRAHSTNATSSHALAHTPHSTPSATPPPNPPAMILHNTTSPGNSSRSPALSPQSVHSFKTSGGSPNPPPSSLHDSSHAQPVMPHFLMENGEAEGW